MKFWYQKRSVISWLLSPLALIYHTVATTRKSLYKNGTLKSTKLSVPVIVVGNITVGGTGKSPMVGWLAELLQAQGFKPGIISRGYKGSLNSTPTLLNDQHTAQEVGDEPLMLFHRLQIPIVICRDRVKAGEYLIEQTDCNMIISDDGLQHYALDRDMEIIMVDGNRRFGNEMCLPAGPLRELKSRCETTPWIVYTQDDSMPYNLHLDPEFLTRTEREQPLTSLKGRTVHAVAGIGNPERFFSLLRRLGATVIPHPMPDHHCYTESDLQFDDDHWVVMTSKDCVKCKKMMGDNVYVLQVKAILSEELTKDLTQAVQHIK